MSAPALPRDTARRIAAHFAPAHPLGNRWDYFYTRAKLGSDPLYPGICDALRGTSAPLLDLGCGLGLLAHALQDAGIALPYRGVDVDTGKIRRAQLAATRAGLPDARFDAMDLGRALPRHRGSVALLDVLQFLNPDAQDATLGAAVDMLEPGAKLVLRTGLADGTRRARITRRVDAFSRALGWMHGERERYPSRDALSARFEAAGLRASFEPLYGNTPFNNWRVVAWQA